MERRGITFANLAPSELLESANATVQSLTASGSVQTALATNQLRTGGFLHNDADRICFVKFGSGASPTSFTVALEAKDDTATPKRAGGSLNLGTLRVYTGLITVIWEASPTGALRITELT